MPNAIPVSETMMASAGSRNTDSADAMSPANAAIGSGAESDVGAIAV
jgi:hypothetical protein